MRYRFDFLFYLYDPSFCEIFQAWVLMTNTKTFRAALVQREIIKVDCYKHNDFV